MYFLFPHVISNNMNECLGPAVCVPDSVRKWSQNYFQLLDSVTYMGLVARKPVFGASDKVRFKPVSTATETG